MTRKKVDPRQPPAYLGDEEKATWKRLMDEYDLQDAPALVLLEQLCRNLQLVRESREIVEAEGKMVSGKEHPLIKVWRDAEKQATIALKALHFDVEPLRDKPGRPPGK